MKKILLLFLVYVLSLNVFGIPTVPDIFGDKKTEETDFLVLRKQSADPGQASTDTAKIFLNSDNIPSYIDDQNNVSAIGSGVSDSSTFYQQDFETKKPSDIVTVTGSWDLTDDISTKLGGKRSLKLTQVAGSLGAIAEIKGIPIESRSIGPLIGLFSEFRYTGKSHDLKLEIIQSDDNVSYDVVGLENGALTLIKSLETTSVQLNGKFRSTATHFGLRLTVLSENIGASLIADNFNFKINPLPTASFVESNEVSLAGNDASAISGTTNIDFSGTGNGWNGSVNEYEVQYSGSTVRLSGALTFTSTTTESARVYINGTYFKTISGGNTSEAPKKFDIELSSKDISKGDKISIRINAVLTLANDTVNHYLTIVEEKKSTNVIFKGHSGGNTQTKILSSDITTDTTNIADLRIEGLEIGREYELTINSLGESTVSSVDNFGLTAQHNGSPLGGVTHSFSSMSAAGAGTRTRVVTFTAKTSNITFDATSISATSAIRGNGTTTETFVQIKPTEPPTLSVPIGANKNTVSIIGATSGTVNGGDQNLPYDGNGTGWDNTLKEYEVQFNDSDVTISAGFLITGTPRLYYLSIYKNGANFMPIEPYLSTDVRSGSIKIPSSLISKGDKLSVRLAGTSTAFTFTNSDAFNKLLIVEEKQEGHFAANVPLSDGQTIASTTASPPTLNASNARWTGEMRGGRKVMAWDLEWTGVHNTAGSIIIANYPLGQKFTRITGSTRWYMGALERDLAGFDFTETGGSSNSFSLTLLPSTGDLTIFLSKSGGDLEVREMRITLEYLE